MASREERGLLYVGFDAGGSRTCTVGRRGVSDRLAERLKVRKLSRCAAGYRVLK